MKGSILVYGGSKRGRKSIYESILIEDLDLKKVANNPDILIIEKEDKKKTIGIAQIRELVKFINEKPFTYGVKAVLVNDAHSLTVQAQNALLKTLEEPPEYASIILESKNLKSILSTVQSRCQKIDARIFGETIENDTDTEDIEVIVRMSIGERLTWAGEFSKEDNRTIIETFENWIFDLEKKLDEKNAINIERLSEIKGDLENTNVNTKLALEYLMFNLE